MLLYLEGFDHLATPDVALLYTNPGGGSPGVINAGAGRFGGNSFSPATAQRNLTVNEVSEAPAGIIFGFACINPTGTMVRLLSGSTLLFSVVYQPSSNNFAVLDSTGAAIATTPSGLTLVGSWFYIEVMIAAWGTGKNVSIQINGQSAATSTGNTGTPASAVLTYEFDTGAGTVDDNYWFDNSGGNSNGFAGVRQVDTRFVSGNGRLDQWTTVGALTNAAAVQDPVQDGDTTFNYSLTPGAKDMYTFQAPSVDPDSVLGIQLDICAREDGTDDASAYIGVGNGSSEHYKAAPDAMSSGYAYYDYPLDGNPFTAAAWAPGDINALQVVVEIPNTNGSSG